MHLNNRVTALEEKNAVNVRPWARVIVHPGQSKEAAVAAALSARGQRPEDVNLIIRVIASTS